MKYLYQGATEAEVMAHFMDVTPRRGIGFAIETNRVMRFPDDMCLTIKPHTAGEQCTMQIVAGSGALAVNMEINTGNGWGIYEVGTTVTFTDAIKLRGTGNTRFGGSTTENANRFILTGDVDCIGDITALADYKGNITNHGSFGHVFENCTTLKVAPSLSLKTLGTNMYYGTFKGCTSLTTAPELPATELGSSCYREMFYGCTGLTTAPELPAMTLANYCYDNMFYGCTGLTTAPELPAMTLANYCYQYMFYGCSSLTSAPELPATELKNSCYRYMFQNCTGLTTAPTELPATGLTTYCYNSMFYGCTSLTTAPVIKAVTVSSSTIGSMFRNCAALSYIECHAISFASQPLWVSGVSSTGTFKKKAGVTYPSGTGGIPTGWTIEEF